jgi:hypothetical protein
MRTSTLPRRLMPRIALAVLLGGCQTVAPTAAPTLAPTVATTPQPPASRVPATIDPSARPAAEVFADIRAAVEQIRGLQPTSDVAPVTIDETQLRKNLETEFDATYTAQQLKDTEDLLHALGLIPVGSSLRTLTLDLEGGQVAGYYSPERNELFVVNRTGRVGPVDEATYAHEFTHQLQDQHVDLDALGIDVADQSDRSLGRLALVEGDATSVQSTWMTANLTPTEMGELLAAALDPAAVAALNNAPAYLRETATFPYQDGLAFVGRLLANGGYKAVDAAFADPPDSTEQILHPEKYLTREVPAKVEITHAVVESVGGGWTQGVEDTLGELILRIWLTNGGVPVPQARAAAAGWGGDRLVLLRHDGGSVAVALHTEWDTAADADEFATAATAAAGSLSGTARVVHEAGSKTVWVAIGDAAVTLTGLATAGT